MPTERIQLLESENAQLEADNLRLHKQLDQALAERDRARNIAVALEQELAQVSNG